MDDLRENEAEDEEDDMKEPTLGNPQNTIEVLQKYNFIFQKKY